MNARAHRDEIREKFPFLLWASGLAALLVISLTVAAFYFETVGQDAQTEQLQTESLARLTDSLANQLPAGIGLPLERLRQLAANDDQTVALADKIFRLALSLPNKNAANQLAGKLRDLRLLSAQLSAARQARLQAERVRLEATMIVLTCLILIVISFFTGRAMGELKHRYRAYRKEQQLNNLKSHFIAVASHEFRTPLSSIQLCISLIEKYALKNDSENILRQGKKIRTTIANLTAILEDFLSLEKLESGKITPVFECFDLSVVCREVIEEIRLMLQPGQALDYSPDETPVTVKLDKHLLRNTITNLLSNAVKYSGASASIRLETKVTATKVIIRVWDNGAGIPPEKQKNLFTPFYRVDPNTSVSGTGLGLSIVKRYTELMSGSISFSSVPGSATSFEICYPSSSRPVVSTEISTDISQ